MRAPLKSVRCITGILLATLLLSHCSQQPVQPQAKHEKHAVTTNNKFTELLKDSAATNPSDAVKGLVQRINQDPDNPEPLYALGYVHMQAWFSNKNPHERELAVNYFNTVLAMVPGNPAVVQSLYSIYYDDTLHNRRVDAFDDAKKLFLQLPESSHRNVNPPSLAKFAATAMWQDQQHQHDHQQLRELLLQAMQESPQTDTVYIQLAKIYAQDHYYPLALATLKLGADNIQDSMPLYKTIATTYDERAEANGCNYEHSGDIANAATYYKRAIALQPDDAELHYDLSRSFFDQNLVQLALNEADIGLSLTNTPAAFATNAQNYSMLGLKQQAQRLLQQANAKGYTTAEEGFHEIYMNEGDWRNAARAFETYVKNAPRFSVYDLIKSDIIAHQTKTPSLLDNKKITTSNDWEEALLSYWTLHKSDADLKKIALNRCEKTEYYFYTGYRDFQEGQVAQARTKFTAALEQNTYRFIERPLARYFLQGR